MPQLLYHNGIVRPKYEKLEGKFWFLKKYPMTKFNISIGNSDNNNKIKKYSYRMLQNIPGNFEYTNFFKMKCRQNWTLFTAILRSKIYFPIYF